MAVMMNNVFALHWHETSMGRKGRFWRVCEMTVIN
jgi:hypothetical protein